MRLGCRMPTSGQANQAMLHAHPSHYYWTGKQMSHSLVIQAALDALESATAAPAKHWTLAAMRELQPVLFDDLLSTLHAIPKAADLSVYAGDGGKEFRFRCADLRNWIDQYPSGVAFPITVAASVEAGKIVAPMRVILMVPMHSEGLLAVPKALAKHYASNIWKDDAAEALGEYGALFMGMYAHHDGQWEFGPVVGWMAALRTERDVFAHAVTILPELVEVKAERCGLTLSEAATALIHDYLTDELGFLLTVRTK